MFSDVLLTVDFDRTMTGPDSKIPQRNLDAVAFFMERKAEQDAFSAVNPREIAEITAVQTVDSAALREDVAASDADREAVLSGSPDTDGCYVRVPRVL